MKIPQFYKKLYSYTNEDKNVVSIAKAAGVKALFLTSKATGIGLPSNSPLTSPWVDLSGNANNATPTNFAGTTASGYDTTDSRRPFKAYDGADDFDVLVNTASLDITAAPLAVFATMYATGASPVGWVFSKVLSSGTTQYGLILDSATSQLRMFLENSSRGSIVIPVNTWINVGAIWDGTAVKYYINGVNGGTNGAYASTLTSRPNVRIGCRSNSDDGTANTFFYRGRMATLSVYSGVNAIESKILRSEREISRPYLT